MVTKKGKHNNSLNYARVFSNPTYSLIVNLSAQQRFNFVRLKLKYVKYISASFSNEVVAFTYSRDSLRAFYVYQVVFILAT